MGVWGLLQPALSWVTFQPPRQLLLGHTHSALSFVGRGYRSGVGGGGSGGCGAASEDICASKQGQSWIFLFFKFQTEILLQ